MLSNKLISKLVQPKFKLGVLTVSCASLVSGSCHEPLPGKTNIILIMADDLGYGDIGCFGNTDIKTPFLDRMASEGLKFTNYYSNGAVSTPTRISLMTGNYQQRAGLEGVIYAQMNKRNEGGISGEDVTIAEIFKENGYSTGIFGKWHLGHKPEHNPIKHGFNEFYGYVSGNVDYISHRDGIGIYDWWHNADSVYEEGYVTDLITARALAFMQQNKDRPFFLYLPHEAVHAPYQGRNDKADRLPGNKWDPFGSRVDKKEAYKEMIEIMDENIGKIFKKVKELDLMNNTLIFFCSDNGALELGNNGGLKGYKTSLWEGGIRVPAIAWKPGEIAPGTISESQLISMDIAPTLLSLAGIKTDVKFDGEDFSKVLLKNKVMHERPLFWRYRNQWAVRKGDWKYLRIKDEEFLFNLKDDKNERINLLSKNPPKVEELKGLLADWENEMGKYKQLTN